MSVEKHHKTILIWRVPCIIILRKIWDKFGLNPWRFSFILCKYFFVSSNRFEFISDHCKFWRIGMRRQNWGQGESVLNSIDINRKIIFQSNFWERNAIDLNNWLKMLTRGSTFCCNFDCSIVLAIRRVWHSTAQIKRAVCFYKNFFCRIIFLLDNRKDIRHSFPNQTLSESMTPALFKRLIYRVYICFS